MKQREGIMETKRTTYNDLPERIDYLISEIRGVKELLTQRIEKPEEIPKYLSLEQALLYLEKKGFLVSKSKLYKMTSESKIPFHKSGNRNYFFPDELDKWMNEQIIGKDEINKPFSIQTIINKNQKKKK